MNRRPNPSIFNWLATLLIAVLALTGCSDGSDGKGHNSPPPEALVSLAQDVSRANGGRAAILHVTTAEGKTWEVAAGLADANAEREAKSSDIVEIGSVSKVFLAASGENPVTMSPTLSWAAGQTLSTVADLAIFVGALYKGELFDRAETLELWKNQYFKPLQGEVPYGLGIMRFDLYGPEAGVFYGHDGQVLGAVALMAYHVETGDVYTAAVNNSQYRSVDSGEGGSTWELAPKLRQIADANR